MARSDQYTEGASMLLNQGLQLKRGHKLLIFCQEGLEKLCGCIRVEAEKLEVKVDIRYFRRSDFIDGYPRTFSPEEIITAAAVVPSGIVLLIEWSEETTKGRLRLLTDMQQTGRTWRIASMPGVDYEGLKMCSGDLKEIEVRSKKVLGVLSRSKSVTIRTPRPDSADEDELIIPIGLFNPTISTGKIHPKTWGNYPSGETFVVPNEGAAWGWVTVRGSFPLYPLNQDEWVRFHIQKGQLVFSSIQASSDKIEAEFSALFFHQAGKPKCLNANSLAELGIGTNQDIDRLTGMPIFDEKVLGTIHIALGRNKQFDGPLESCLHHDIVCTDVSAVIGDTVVIQDGKFVLTDDDAIPSLDAFDPCSVTDVAVRLNGKFLYNYSKRGNSEGALFEVIYPSGRRGDVPFSLATGDEAKMAMTLLRTIENQASAISLSTLLQSVDPKKVNMFRRIVNGLLYYRVIEYDDIR